MNGSVGKVELQPSLGKAFRAMWSFQWRSSLTGKKFWMVILSIIALPLLLILTVDAGRHKVYFMWVFNFYMFLILPLHCLQIFGAMIRDDLQGDTIAFLTTRPVPRYRLYLARYLSTLVWTQAVLGLKCLLLLGIGLWRGIPEVANFAPLFLATNAVGIIVFGAIGGFFGLVHQRYMVIGLIYGFVVEIGIGRIPTNINSLSMTHHLQTFLATNSTLAERFDWLPDGVVKGIIMIAIATTLFLAGSMALFTWREYHATAEMQK